MSELRLDPLSRTWVVIAPDRAHRPSDFATSVHAIDGAPCPLCLARDGEAEATVIARRAGAQDDDVTVLANRFPALGVEGQPRRGAAGPYAWVAGVGSHEVIVETRAHGLRFADLSEEQVTAVLLAWRDRVADRARDPRIHHVALFKNEGPMAGATLSHPHSQLIATPITPTRVTAALTHAQAHLRDQGRCLGCDVAELETGAGARLVEVHERFLAYCPFAARHPYEVVIQPRAHHHDFGQVSDADARGLAGVLRRTLQRLRRALGAPDYNLALHTAPSAHSGHTLQDVERAWHWHLEIVPRVQSYGGFEVGFGVYINPVAPESAAERLRQARSGPAGERSRERGPGLSEGSCPR